MKASEIKMLTNLVMNGNYTDIAEYINSVSSGSFSDEDMEILKDRVNNPDEDIPYEKVGDNQYKSYDIEKMSKEIKKSVVVDIPTRAEARYISDIYYQIQTMRIAADNQLRSMAQDFDQDSDDIAKGKTKSNPAQSKPFIKWYCDQLKQMETEIGKALTIFSDSCYMGKWAKANIGIGPTIATQLVAYLDIPSETDFYAGNWWSYCGLNDNNRPWLGREKSLQLVNKFIPAGTKNITDQMVLDLSVASKWSYTYYNTKCRNENGTWSRDALIKATAKVPYNKHLKVLMYKIGHQFMMVKNNDKSLYGKIIVERLAYETEKNNRGDYKDQCEKILSSKNFSKSTNAYKEYSQGRLPKGHLMQRAQRYATKMFISHLFEAEYFNKFGVAAPHPYELAIAGHKGYVGPEVKYDSIPFDGI